MRWQLRQRLPVAIALLMLPACVDPGGVFDDFTARVPANPTPVGDGGGGDAATCNVAPQSISGQYLLALSVTLAPTKPIVALTQLDTPETKGGTGFTFSAQPLSAADRTTPVGSPLDFGPFDVGQDGTFRGDLPGLSISGAANSITGGDISADAALEGSLCGDGDFYCGTVSGKVTSPIPLDLAGSSFTLTRIPDSGEIPTRPRLDCSGALADAP